MGDEQKASAAPRVATRVPEVRQEYANWIPYYAPGITFKPGQPEPEHVPNVATDVGQIRPTSTFPVVSNVATMVPRYSNVF